MANNFNDSTITAVIGTSFDGMTIRPLRPEYPFDAASQEKVWDLNSNPNRGSAMTFVVQSAQSANTAALDPTAATISGSVKESYTRRSVTLELYGDHSVLDTLQFPKESFVNNALDVAFSMQDQAFNSINLLARTKADLNKYSNEASGTISSTYHFYGSSGTASTIGPLKAIDVRKITAKMKASNVKTYEDGNYICILDPLVATQLKAETGNDAWRAAAIAGDQAVQRVWAGDIGVFEGVRFIVNNTCLGAGTDTVTAYFLGREGIGKALGADLRVKTKSSMDGPHDNLLTFFWDVLLGYKVIRREAVRTIQTDGSAL